MRGYCITQHPHLFFFFSTTCSTVVVGWVGGSVVWVTSTVPGVVGVVAEGDLVVVVFCGLCCGEDGGLWLMLVVGVLPFAGCVPLAGGGAAPGIVRLMLILENTQYCQVLMF